MFCYVFCYCFYLFVYVLFCYVLFCQTIKPILTFPPIYFIEFKFFFDHCTDYCEYCRNVFKGHFFATKGVFRNYLLCISSVSLKFFFALFLFYPKSLGFNFFCLGQQFFFGFKDFAEFIWQQIIRPPTQGKKGEKIKRKKQNLMYRNTEREKK